MVDASVGCRALAPADTYPAHRAGGHLWEVYPARPCQGPHDVPEMASQEAVLGARVLLRDDPLVVVGASLDVVLLPAVVGASLAASLAGDLLATVTVVAVTAIETVG